MKRIFKIIKKIKNLVFLTYEAGKKIKDLRILMNSKLEKYCIIHLRSKSLETYPYTFAYMARSTAIKFVNKVITAIKIWVYI